MDILLISALVLLGILFLVVEVLILPGVSIGGLLSVASYIGAVYMAYVHFGGTGVAISAVVIIAVSAIALFFSLRSKTWNRLALEDKLDAASGVAPQSELNVGDEGESLSRLAPMGRVAIGGKSYEAKSSGEYIEEHSAVEVVAFENSNVVVRKRKQY